MSAAGAYHQRMRFPLGLRPVLVLGLCLGMGAGLSAAPAAAGVARGRSGDDVVVSISGEPGDPVTGGTTRAWHSGSDSVTVSRVEDGLSLTATSPDGTRSELRLEAQRGSRFTNGMYFDATPAPTAGRPILDVTIGDRSCPGARTSQFRVLDSTPDLERVWVLFEQRCGESGGSAFGEIRINMGGDSSLVVAPARVEFPVQPAGTGGVTTAVTLINIGSQPITFGTASVVGRPTKTVFSPVGDDEVGVAGTLSFTISENTCTTLQPGERCVLVVTYRPLLPGPVEANLVLPDSTPAGRHQVSLAGVAT